MFNQYFIFLLVIVAVSGQENDVGNSFEPSLDVLIPTRNLDNTRRMLLINKNRNVNQVKESQESSCGKTSQKDEEEPRAINSIDEPSPTSQQLHTSSGLTSPIVYKAVPEDQVVGYSQNNKHSAPKDHEPVEPSALELRLAWPDNEQSRRSDNSLIDPSDLAAELQDCLEKKLHQKKPNVVVVMPVLDSKQPSEDANDGQYLLSFAKTHGNINLRESDVNLRDAEEDSDIIKKQEGNCNKDQNKDEKDKSVETGNELKKDSNEEKEQLAKNDTFGKLESKVQKFLRTGITEDSIESDKNLDALDGRRRDNYYERLPLTDVVDDNHDNGDQENQNSVAVEPVASETYKSENSRSGVTERRVCYACSTLNNPSCLNPNRMTTVKYCAGSRNLCVKKTYETGGTSVLIRDCAATCDDTVLPVGIIPNYKTCDLCHDDLCNGAYVIKNQGLLIFFLLTSWVLCKILV